MQSSHKTIDMYEQNKKILLCDVSFHIPAAKITAIFSRDKSDKYLMKFLSLQKNKKNYTA